MSWDQKLFQLYLETRRFGRESVYLEEVDSTNKYLLERYNQFSLLGSAVISGHQTHGQGRQGRHWYDERGKSLLFSVLLKYSTGNTASGFLSLLPAIALADLLESEFKVDEDIKIKWPNDVLINGKKIAGILGQNILTDKTHISILGVGINVEQDKSNFPLELQNTASSIFLETSQVLSKELFLAKLLNKWEIIFDFFIDEDIKAIVSEYKRYEFSKGKEISRTENGLEICGKYVGIGDQGQLILEHVTGQRQEFYTGDISFAVSH